MNKIISRHLISPNFLGHSLIDNVHFNRQDLIDQIDFWKYILKYKFQAQHQESILIGMQTMNLDYLALCLASAEFGLKLVIIDYGRLDDFDNTEYSDPKTRLLSPIDIFVYDFTDQEIAEDPGKFSKYRFFTQCSRRSYSIHTVDRTKDAVKMLECQNILADPTDIVMRCTSSGTTGTPKIIEHTHEFIAAVSMRNADYFHGLCLHVRNLNHGSSLAVYLLPTLISPKVTVCLFLELKFDEPITKEFLPLITPYQDSLQFVLINYYYQIDLWVQGSLELNLHWPQLNVQTLSYIQGSTTRAIQQGTFKSIRSIFGSNETSGPIFTAYIDQQNLNQDLTLFELVDDFYTVTILPDNLLSVTLPIYRKEIQTNDCFMIEDQFYKHLGRSDMVKINGEIIDLQILADLNQANPQAYLITDTVNNTVYLAFWQQRDNELLIEYSNFFNYHFKRVRIGKTAVLDKHRFLSGIKIDNELLREHFRKCYV